MAQNWHFWSIWARPCRLIQCPVGGSVGGFGGRAVSRKTPIYFISIHELSAAIYFRMVNDYKEWAHRAMREGWEVVTFARHKDHLPIVRGQLEPLKSLISSVLSGDLVDGVDYEYAEEDQVFFIFL